MLGYHPEPVHDAMWSSCTESGKFTLCFLGSMVGNFDPIGALAALYSTPTHRKTFCGYSEHLVIYYTVLWRKWCISPANMWITRTFLWKTSANIFFCEFPPSITPTFHVAPSTEAYSLAVNDLFGLYRVRLMLKTNILPAVSLDHHLI